MPPDPAAQPPPSESSPGAASATAASNEPSNSASVGGGGKGSGTAPSSSTSTPSLGRPGGKRSKKKVVALETCPSYGRGHLNARANLDRYRTLCANHIESFNHFLSQGLQRGVSDLDAVEVDLVDPKVARENEARGIRKSASAAQGVDTIKFWFENVSIGMPAKEYDGGGVGMRGVAGAKGRRMLTPRECREMGLVYSGAMMGDFCYQILHRDVDNVVSARGRVVRINKRMGDIPIMVGSKKCHLAGKSPAELVRLKEEDNETGGYFIVNGIERLIRILQVQRRNHPVGLLRPSFRKRGPTYTDAGVSVRSANAIGDQTTVTNTMHYLSTGGVTVRFGVRKQEFLVPVILLLRATRACTDEELFRRIVQGARGADDRAGNRGGGSGGSGSGCGCGGAGESFLRSRADLLLQDARRFGFYTPEESLAYLGARFRSLTYKPASWNDADVGHYILKRYILIHLNRYSDKQECLLLMLRKLYALVDGSCGADNSDSLQNQEVLLPGHLISAVVKEKLGEVLAGVRLGVMRDMRTDFRKGAADVQTQKYWSRAVDRNGMLGSGGIGKKVALLLSTGNLQSSSGLDLMQTSGFTVVAERINFLRYLSHFRSVHRGQFFTQMRSTAVRKLLPDQWGFLCPVHTPDGGPCGLLSHLSLKCDALSYPEAKTGGALRSLDGLLISLGVVPAGAGGDEGEGKVTLTAAYLPVCIDGRVLGGALAKTCRAIASHLRQLKVAPAPTTVPPTLEVAFIPPEGNGAPYPGLFLFTDAARLVRPVLHRASGRVEMIGPMEQPFMDIACIQDDVREGITTHLELDPTNMLSLIASLTPFSDYNQSPRNMYQCQMAKQTMGTPCHSFPQRVDNKLYRLQNLQAPVVQTARHKEFKMDEYPNGCNAVVAVLSYTGFDMEDAMIINKSSYERGFGHASVYKTMIVDLEEETKHSRSGAAGDQPRMRFSNIRPKSKRPRHPRDRNDGKTNLIHDSLDVDGLPMMGMRVEEYDPLYCIVDDLTGAVTTGRHKEKESAIIQSVRLLGQNDSSSSGMKGSRGTLNKVSITLRIPRNPVIGDKFSSRHGQKGVLSILWPQQDMPFSESGICPDVIINPHAFPSRMTIGMLIESMAGKSGALHGIFQDATPFSFHESGDKLAIDHFGEQLEAAGYSYYGSEPLYSGVSGCLMQADLYIGIVFYQRLRHMVSDKFQVRAKGPVNPLTRQPTKGRKKGGGIRLGEMERDSLLSHGAAFILRDRLMNCSDRSLAYACSRCGDLLSPSTERCAILSTGQSAAAAANKARLRVFCRNAKCAGGARRESGDDESIEPIVLPYVYRYLVNELAGMNIKMRLKIK